MNMVSRPGFIIRPALPGDAPGMAEVHVQGWREAYAGLLPQEMLDRLSLEERAGMWRGVTARKGRAPWTLVAADGAGAILGFIHALRLRPAPFGASARLVALYVLAQHQRRGIGRALTREVAVAMVEVGVGELRLWCLWNNEATRRFYDRLGGRINAASVETTRGFRTILAGYSWPSAGDLARGCQN